MQQQRDVVDIFVGGFYLPRNRRLVCVCAIEHFDRNEMARPMKF